MRHLVVILGDQLNADATAFSGFDAAQDAVWMAEVRAESTHVPSSKVRTALFLAAMRHFREAQRALGHTVHYRELPKRAPSVAAAAETKTTTDTADTLGAALAADLAKLKPQAVVLVQPGDFRVLQQLRAACGNTPLQVREDNHFLCSLPDFAAWAAPRKELRMEYFYRWMRRRTGALMEDDQPIGGEWNYDSENRAAFGKQGPGLLPAPQQFAPDELTREVVTLVESEFSGHVGNLAHFDWPVTPEDAAAALHDFINHRLAAFGPFQDALWPGEPWLYHSRLASALNLKLLSPQQVIAAAEAAWRQHRLPIASVEGFIRQILGWREYVRGIYWLKMPEYVERNALGATQPLPEAFWTGDTDMACLRDALQQTLEYGYAHHIQRLMVTGLYALLLGVDPKALHEWYLAVYVDAVEWVELPNTLGMSQFADGGLLGSKPYIASGKYLQKMGPYCAGCRYRPDESTGDRACPYTTLYWDFLDRHEERFRNHPRLALQVRNVARLSAEKRTAIREQAAAYRARLLANSPKK